MDLIQVTISSVLCVVLIYLMVYEHKQMEQKNKFPYFDNLAERVNTMNNTWKAKQVDPLPLYVEPSQTMVNHILKNTIMENKLKEYHLLWKRAKTIYSNDDNLPKRFDAREAWPNCTTIGKVYDIGSSKLFWSTPIAQMISDRICIHSNGTRNVEISASDISICVPLELNVTTTSDIVHDVLKHYLTYGFVTGGEYGSNIGCKPYWLPKCNHGTMRNHYRVCIEQESDLSRLPSCVRSCTNPTYGKSYQDDLHYGSIITMPENVNEIMSDLMLNGPLVVNMDIFTGFYIYDSGIYQLVPGEALVSTNVLKLIGWGTENGIDYWLLVNSWNEYYGMNGTIKIVRGINEFNIEIGAFSVLPLNSHVPM
ncbi:hypothetical protein RDWZM_010567 [Blomia tropicalis]|uniref:Peptidase C1A papain C-terminal domain-containing protein n=1 Tax=Blomia tropicalis TaxID=40697 RepID=A0A9Q0LZF7_BLOTA|nr:hypothetical protein RDWZM_010567 [Blomia tropicalis]